MTLEKKETKQVKKKADTRTRVQKIKAATHEQMRNKFKAMEYIRQLEKSAKDLNDIRKKQSLKKNADDHFMLGQQVLTIKVLIDLNIKRLKFCLPELKSMEFKDPNGDNPFTTALIALAEAAKNC